MGGPRLRPGRPGPPRLHGHRGHPCTTRAGPCRGATGRTGRCGRSGWRTPTGGSADCTCPASWPSPWRAPGTPSRSPRRTTAPCGRSSPTPPAARTATASASLRPAPPAADGSVTVDFNRALLPPCAFAAHFICPLPAAGQHPPRRRRRGGAPGARGLTGAGRRPRRAVRASSRAAPVPAGAGRGPPVAGSPARPSSRAPAAAAPAGTPAAPGRAAGGRGGRCPGRRGRGSGSAHRDAHGSAKVTPSHFMTPAGAVETRQD